MATSKPMPFPLPHASSATRVLRQLGDASSVAPLSRRAYAAAREPCAAVTPWATCAATAMLARGDTRLLSCAAALSATLSEKKLGA